MFLLLCGLRKYLYLVINTVLLLVDFTCIYCNILFNLINDKSLKNYYSYYYNYYYYYYYCYYYYCYYYFFITIFFIFIIIIIIYTVLSLLSIRNARTPWCNILMTIRMMGSVKNDCLFMNQYWQVTVYYLP